MAALLDAILADKTMTHKEKSTKLKMVLNLITGRLFRGLVVFLVSGAVS